MPNLQRLLDARVAEAMRAAFPDAPDFPAVVMPAQGPRFGDYQANGAMGLAKHLKKKPRDVASAIVENLDVADVADAPEIAGPGFINLRLRADWLSAELGRANADDRLGVVQAPRPQTVVVDYSAPNLAKEMHVGHLRSTIIGDALARMLDFAGHKVVRQNHVGDWGTQFGMLCACFEEWSASEHSAPDVSFTRHFAGGVLSDMEFFYQRAKRRFDDDLGFALRAKEAVVKLQQGDPDVRSDWESIRDISLEHCRKVYRRLGVLLGDRDVRGESAYNGDLPRVVEALREKGLLTESEGAQCVFLDGFSRKDGEPLPFIIQKSDEGFLYATTDLAALAFRTGRFSRLADGSKSPEADRILYVVDARQSLHFRQLFAVARAAGFAAGHVALEHVAFGMMLGEDGRPFRTREGGTVKLMDLLDEAERRALDLVGEKSPGLSVDEQKAIARIVGIGAVKYADLAQNRTSDYVFSWDKMLSLQGNTAPYMQYAYARVRSIFRRGGHEAEDHRADADPLALGESEELALAKMLLRFAETLDRALEDWRPNILAGYLFDLAQAFTTFYEACPVLKSDEPVRTGRLKLCDLTARTIARGLDLLGIETADRL